MKKLVIAALLCSLLLPAVSLAQGGDVSFNTATADEMVEMMAGLVDKELADTIVAYRTQNGAFKDPEELRKVPGMSGVIFNQLKPELKDGDIVYVDEVPTGMHSY